MRSILCFGSSAASLPSAGSSTQGYLPSRSASSRGGGGLPSRADPSQTDRHRSGELLRVRATFAALALILLSNIFGFLLLSNFLRVIFVLSSYIGLVILLQARAISILIAAAVRLKPMNSLATIRLHEASVVRWTRRALGIGAAFWWLYLVLDLLALRGDVSNANRQQRSTRKSGSRDSALSLGNLLACLCLLVGGFLVARGIRFILREEILARVRLSRGVAETVATSVYYVSLLLVPLMSLVAAGVQLDKLTVLTGAFGVGVGFGMQNIIANFVSGLVLQFERPIRIGDVLEVGNLAGEVQRIGVRASLIRTFQGADVIVPNSTLVSNQVVNWTLSEPIRRVDLQVPVAYGTAPERVIQLLATIARGHPGVLRHPEPGAFFQGFGPNSLDFILMFWAEQQTHFRLRSEIAIAVNAALHEAGIEIPLPQREVRVLSSESPAARAPRRAGNAGRRRSPRRPCSGMTRKTASRPAPRPSLLPKLDSASESKNREVCSMMKSLRVLLPVMLFAICGLAQDVRYNFAAGENFSKFKTYKWVKIKDAQEVNQLAEQTVEGRCRRGIGQEGPAKDGIRRRGPIHRVSGGYRHGKAIHLV